MARHGCEEPPSRGSRVIYSRTLPGVKQTPRNSTEKKIWARALPMTARSPPSRPRRSRRQTPSPTESQRCRGAKKWPEHARAAHVAQGDGKGRVDSDIYDAVGISAVAQRPIDPRSQRAGASGDAWSGPGLERCLGRTAIERRSPGRDFRGRSGRPRLLSGPCPWSACPRPPPGISRLAGHFTTGSSATRRRGDQSRPRSRPCSLDSIFRGIRRDKAESRLGSSISALPSSPKRC